MKKSVTSIRVISDRIRLCLLYIIALCPVLLISCEEIMDVSFTGDSVNTLVVDGLITTQKRQHRVILTYTGDFFKQPERRMVTGAKVTITDGSSTFVLNELSGGSYFTADSIKGEIGKTYTLNIELADGQQYSASDYLGPCAVFDSIGQTLNHKEYMGDYGYDVLFYGLEPEPAGNYYMFLLYKNNELYSDTITEVTFANDEFINGMHVRDYVVYRIREADLERPAMITLEMNSINKGYYDFMSALMIETVWKGSPWDGPPASLPSNLSNGARGYFRASDMKRHSKNFLPQPRSN